MTINNKLIKTVGLLSSIVIFGCEKAPLTSKKEDCVMPEESMFELQNVKSINILNKNNENDDLNADADADADADDLPRVCDIPTQALNAQLDINAELKKFNDIQEKKMRETLKRLKVIVNSEVFKERVLAHTYKGETTYVQNDGLTNEEIYEKIMTGAEELLPDPNKTMDLDIQLYYSSKNVIGYTYPNVLQIWVNKKYFNTNSYGSAAANVMHEWLHKIGFGHDFKRTSRRPYSVPYGIGSIVKKLVNDM